MPDGVLAAFGVAPARWATAPAWATYLHVGGYALVPIVFVAEYAFRRWHLRGIAHPPLAQFAHRAITRWPMLLHSLAADARSPR
jgi:hypothetical protein